MKYDIISDHGAFARNLDSFDEAVAKLEEIKKQGLIGSAATGIRIVGVMATFDDYAMDKEAVSPYPDENRAEFKLAQVAKHEIIEDGDLEFDAVYGRADGQVVRLSLGSNMTLDMVHFNGELESAYIRVFGFSTEFISRFEGPELADLEDAARHHLVQ